MRQRQENDQSDTTARKYTNLSEPEIVPLLGAFSSPFFFKTLQSPAESIAPNRPDHGHSVHGEPKFTKESSLCTTDPNSGW